MSDGGDYERERQERIAANQGTLYAALRGFPLEKPANHVLQLFSRH